MGNSRLGGTGSNNQTRSGHKKDLGRTHERGEKREYISRNVQERTERDLQREQERKQE